MTRAMVDFTLLLRFFISSPHLVVHFIALLLDDQEDGGKYCNNDKHNDSQCTGIAHLIGPERLGINEKFHDTRLVARAAVGHNKNIVEQ